MAGSADPYATGAYPTGTYATGTYDTGTYDTGSYGQVHDSGQWYAADGQHQQGQYAATAQPYASSYETGGYDTGSWDGAGYGQQQTGQWETQGHDGQQGEAAFVHLPHQGFETQTFGTGTFETGTAFDTGAFGTGALQAEAFATQTFPAQTGFETQAFETQAFETQTFDAQAFDAQAFETQSFDAQAVFETQTFDSSVLLQDPAYDTGAHDATAWNSAGADTPLDAHDQGHAHVPDQYVPDQYTPEDAVAEHAAESDREDDAQPQYDAEHPNPWEPEAAARADEPRTPARPAPRGGRAASRRRTPAKRSALLTVAVPSVCAIGVAGVAAASVGGSNLLGGDDAKETKAAAAPDVQTVKPSVANNKLDTQLRGLSADAGDFADRASRTQERIDLKAKQEAERKKAAEEAARKEAARPKFALPVKQHGLSAYFGQAGINWMSSHTGIDFPVSYAPVMAATDGTVRTQFNSAYGNMAIVTAKDGTETWYCHLSRHTVLSGPVKAGDVIATSGDSGNSTGPHMHFEVHPGGGAAVDPLPWLRSHGLDPT
ncbi:peptidoglycan DD-metalloendopeptidase family protein [Streptomyces sp. SID5785]|nr:M23 family metallopeptidase [Streptomyces sp. SID5785]MZD09394.1 peptidoglycan DD-metalloendopeptidase family protein [Streptomyces sp. SID5785]